MNERRSRLFLHAAMLGLCGGVILTHLNVAPIHHTPFKPTSNHQDVNDLPSYSFMLSEYVLSPIIIETIPSTPTPVPEPPTKTKLLSFIPQTIWEGKATSYSVNGCLGCREDRLMANGEPLNDNALTIAFMRTSLNSFVKVENLDNGKSIMVRVTDRGGFETWGRIADVTPAVRRAIDLITDISRIRVSLIE